MSAVLQPKNYPKFTSADLAVLPEDGKLYEIIEGDLLISQTTKWYHQYAKAQILLALQRWDSLLNIGFANCEVGLIYDETNDVSPDVVWVSKERLAQILGEDGKLHASPEIAVEVMSPGWSNQVRDRQLKLKLYSRRGVEEYWIVDWQQRTMEIYRRENEQLTLAVTLRHTDILSSPLLPGFACNVAQLFFPPPVKSS
ncbi:MAG TPA: Uma2 family endonuclease [Blastocatellia bacterium]|nr:Uma2 family endonuclease [Blastocatellia bacterium]